MRPNKCERGGSRASRRTTALYTHFIPTYKNKGVEGGMFFSLFVALSALLKDERRWEEEGKGGEIMSFKLSLI